MANKSPYNSRNTRFRCPRCGYTDKIGMFHPVEGKAADVQCPKAACRALAFAVPRATSFRPRPAKKLAVRA